MNAPCIIQAATPLVTFREMLAGDAVQLGLQPSQHECLGVVRPVCSFEDGQDLVQSGPAWTAIGEGGRILACAGFHVIWEANEHTGGHAIAWALLAEGIGLAHPAITRFARERIAESPYSRIEAIVRANVKAERSWARLVGFGRPHVLRAYGPKAEPHLLFERIREKRSGG